jgi:hypothetical protein
MATLNSKEKKLKKCIILTERIVYFFLAIILIVPFLHNKSTKDINILHTILFSIILVYHFGMCNFWDLFDSLHIKNRLLTKYFEANNDGTNAVESYSRKGDAIVINVYVIYVLFLFLGCYNQLLKWNYLLSGMLVLLGLNNVFKYKICLIKKIAYNHKINCCADCHIVGWENILIFSVVPFMMYINKFNLLNIILSTTICILSLIELIYWEYSLYFNPERFSPLSNKMIGCHNCQKLNCTGSFDKKYFENRWGVYHKESSLKLKNKIEEHYVAVGLMGAALLTILEFFLLGEEYFMKYYIFMIIVFFELTSFWVIYKWVEKKYKVVFKHIENIVIWKDNKKDTNYYENFANKIFGITTINNILIYLISVLLLIGLILLLYIVQGLDVPSYFSRKNIIISNSNIKIKMALALTLLCIPIMIACRSFVIFYNSFRQLAYISTLEVKTDYYTTGYKHYLEIKRFCSIAVVIMTFVCLTSIIAVFNGPIHLTGNIKKVIFTLLILISICPTVILIGTKYYLHEIQYKMKEKMIEKCNILNGDDEIVCTNTETETKFSILEKELMNRDAIINFRIGEKKFLVIYLQ